MQQFLISALCLCLCLAATSAAASGRDLRVGLSDEYPPLSYIDEDGQRRGFEYELADSLCRRLGRTCVWTFTTQADLVQRARGFWPEADIVTGSVQELIRRLRQGSIDVLFINDLAGYAFLLTDEGLEFDRLDVPFDAETRATGSCVAVRAGRPELLDAVNRALKALLYSGELHNRSRSYFQYIIY